MVDAVLLAMALDRLKYGNARVPRHWKINRVYEVLVARGLAKEVVDEDQSLIRQFRLATDEEKENFTGSAPPA